MLKGIFRIVFILVVVGLAYCYVRTTDGNQGSAKKEIVAVANNVGSDNEWFPQYVDPYSIRGMYSLSGLACLAVMIYYFIKMVICQFTSGHIIRALIGFWIWQGVFMLLALVTLFNIYDGYNTRDYDLDGKYRAYEKSGYSRMVMTIDGWKYEIDMMYDKNGNPTSCVEFDRLTMQKPNPDGHLYNDDGTMIKGPDYYLAMHVKESDHYIAPWYIYHPIGFVWWAAPLFCFGISLKFIAVGIGGGR
jgi:hypothetical protein